MPTLKHAILGAGGVGGLIGATAAHFGAPVTMIVRPEAAATYRSEIQLESSFGNLRVPVAHAVEAPACDVLWITVKATQLDAALSAIGKPESVGAIVPLLNGIDHIAALRSRFGAGKVIPATIAVESERVAPGHFVHRSPFCRLNVASAGKPLLNQTLENFQKFGFECGFIDNEATLMWSKLVFLAAFALTTTAADTNIGGILKDPKWRELGVACIREGSAVAVAEGAAIDTDTVIAAALKMHDAMRSSMQKDVEQGNPPELDAIAGPILRGARKHNLEVPATKELVALVERRTKFCPSLLQ